MQSKRALRKLSLPAIAMVAVALAWLLADGCASTRKSVREEVDDAALTSNIKARLAADPDVAARRIDVDVKDGVVTLRGKVESDFEKREATSVAINTSGVRSVHNRLSIGEVAASAQFSDAWITSKVKARLLADPDVRGLDIDVDTTDGKVTLSGKANSQRSIRHAGQLARNTEGVVQVDNRIELRARRGALEKKSRQEAAEWEEEGY